MAEIVNICDALASRLTSTHSIPSSAVYSIHNVSDATRSISGNVYPGNTDRVKLTRAGDFLVTYDVNIYISKRLNDQSKASVAAELDTIETVIDDLMLARINGHQCYGIEQSQPYEYELLELESIFASIITIKYREAK